MKSVNLDVMRTISNGFDLYAASLRSETHSFRLCCSHINLALVYVYFSTFCYLIALSLLLILWEILLTGRGRFYKIDFAKFHFSSSQEVRKFV